MIDDIFRIVYHRMNHDYRQMILDEPTYQSIISIVGDGIFSAKFPYHRWK